MAIMMGSLYEALVEGGTRASAAKKAAEEVADHQKQLGYIRTDMALLKALAGAAVTGIVALAIKTFFA